MTRQHWIWLGVIVAGLVGFAVYQEHRNPGVAGGVSWGTAFGNMLEHFHLGNWAPFGRTNVVKAPTGGFVNLTPNSQGTGNKV